MVVKQVDMELVSQSVEEIAVQDIDPEDMAIGIAMGVCLGFGRRAEQVLKMALDEIRKHDDCEHDK